MHHIFRYQQGHCERVLRQIAPYQACIDRIRQIRFPKVFNDMFVGHLLIAFLTKAHKISRCGFSIMTKWANVMHRKLYPVFRSSTAF